jgi:hypothetical protein
MCPTQNMRSAASYISVTTTDNLRDELAVLPRAERKWRECPRDLNSGSVARLSAKSISESGNSHTEF